MKVDGATKNYIDSIATSTVSNANKISKKTNVKDTSTNDVSSVLKAENMIPKTIKATTDEAETENENQEQQEKNVMKAIEKANKQFKTYDRKLEFSIHEATKEIMVKVINTEDDKVIREIPSEKVLDMVAKMWEVAGILVDEKR